MTEIFFKKIKFTELLKKNAESSEKIVSKILNLTQDSKILNLLH